MDSSSNCSGGNIDEKIDYGGTGGSSSDQCNSSWCKSFNYDVAAVMLITLMRVVLVE